MKPYICAICDEHRDAHDSPPIETEDGEGLVCEECQNALETESERASEGEPAYLDAREENR